MILSKFYLPTTKEVPVDAETISHQLMIRSGMIKKVASGIYTWLPLGLIVCKKVSDIIRDEMNAIDALEIDMPNVQPATLWEESGRFLDYGPELLRFKDRHSRDFCLGPTHEEVVTDTIKGVVKSYKQLPLTLYQIQKKFRDEIRPRFGIMRGREFIMKDAYSFHTDSNSLKETYKNMYDAYTNIFTRLGLDFRAVDADNGSIGGSGSHEFHVLAETGEDFIVFSDKGDFAANLELAPCPAYESLAEPFENLEEVSTPNKKTIKDVCEFLGTEENKSLKTLVALDEDDNLVALCLLGNHKLNNIKVEKISGLKVPFTLASPELIEEKLSCTIGSIGPVNFPGRVIVDHAALATSNLLCGANKDDYHFKGLNFKRDCGSYEIADIRNIEEGEKTPDGGNAIIKKGIEVGHIFQLGNKYSKSMSLSVLDQNGKAIIPEMGCYGIGVTRIVGAAIEQNHDDFGITFPDVLAPFKIAICPIGYDKSERVKEYANTLYDSLKKKNIDVVLDDRGLRPGFMFSDIDLIGVPHRIVVSEKTLDKNQVEYKARKEKNTIDINQSELDSFLNKNLL